MADANASADKTKSKVPGVPPLDKSDEDLTVGEFIQRHAQSTDNIKITGHDKDGKPLTEKVDEGYLADMNNDQIAEALNISTSEVVAIERELGHKLPEGAN